MESTRIYRHKIHVFGRIYSIAHIRVTDTLWRIQDLAVTKLDCEKTGVGTQCTPEIPPPGSTNGTECFQAWSVKINAPPRVGVSPECIKLIRDISE